MERGRNYQVCLTGIREVIGNENRGSCIFISVGKEWGVANCKRPL